MMFGADNACPSVRLCLWFAPRRERSRYLKMVREAEYKTLVACFRRQVFERAAWPHRGRGWSRAKLCGLPGVATPLIAGLAGLHLVHDRGAVFHVFIRHPERPLVSKGDRIERAHIGGISSKFAVLVDPNIPNWPCPPTVVTGMLEAECSALFNR